MSGNMRNERLEQIFADHKIMADVFYITGRKYKRLSSADDNLTIEEQVGRGGGTDVEG